MAWLRFVAWAWWCSEERNICEEPGIVRHVALEEEKVFGEKVSVRLILLDVVFLARSQFTSTSFIISHTISLQKYTTEIHLLLI
jgi:hypothetical protein